MPDHQHMSDAELFAASQALNKAFWQAAERFADNHGGCHCSNCLDNCLMSAALNMLGQLFVRSPDIGTSRGYIAVRYRLEESLRLAMDHWEQHRDKVVQPQPAQPSDLRGLN